MMSQRCRVAISSDFFSAFSRLPKAQQGKTSKFITNFQKDPAASAIHYEKIPQAADPGMRSVRIDQAYRGIVLKPENGNVYLLLWVDHHDAAYTWARRHRCSINSATGGIQVYEAEARGSDEAPLQQATAVTTHEAIAPLKDRELLRLGIPQPLMGLTRSIQTEADLDACETRLPEEAAEAIYMLLAGYSYAEILLERAETEQVVDTVDFSAALDRLVTKSHFFIADDEIELQAMLHAPLDKWRVFLHPSQRKMATGSKHGAVRILGGAGTGKTVVAMHRAKWLAENVAFGGLKILFTTFTKNLAADIQANLQTICSPRTLEKIEVVNLDRWVSRFLRAKNYACQIIYDGNNNQRTLWEKAVDLAPTDLGLSDAFYREEWQRVIQPQSIVTLDQYKRASRIGRGTRLNRPARVKVWVVFEEYRNLLALNKKKEVDDAYRDAAQLLGHESGLPKFAAVVIDEAQDMSMQAFRMLRQLVPEGENDLFIVGDGHQRIYGRNKVVLSHCGINIRGRARKLRLNYRTTEEIRAWAVNLLEGFPVDDLDGGLDDNKGYKSLAHGLVPQIEHFATPEQQGDFLADYLKAINKQDLSLQSVCIVARLHQELTLIMEQLKQLGVPCHEITAEKSDAEHNGSVRIATMHRVKGLEFDEVILISMNEGIIPLARILAEKGDAVEARQADLEERSLVYVAMTRARKKLIVTHYGQQSPYLSATDSREESSVMPDLRTGLNDRISLE